MRIYLKNCQRSTRLNLPRIRRDLNRALLLLGFEGAELSVIFVNSRRMRELNSLYRNIGKTTDVLSFPMSDKPSPEDSGPLGDIVICVPRTRSQAREYGVRFYPELLRLLIHGLLHLLGYDHEIGAYQKRKMQKKERELFNALQAVA